MKVQADYVLEGAIISLACAHSFLKDAILLYRRYSHASACVLGTIAAEHIGQCQWLLGKRVKLLKESEPFDCRKFEEETKRDHLMMIKEGLVAVQYNVPASIARLAETIISETCGGPEYECAVEMFEKTHKTIRNKIPGKFLDLRVESQYVKPIKNCTEWNRPDTIGQEQVHDLLLNVGNSYRTTLYLQMLKATEALQKMSQMNLKVTLTDVSCTWPPPEGDLPETGK